MSAAKGNAIKLAINCDMGESFGLYRIGDDEGMMPHITIANVACGFHASDSDVMRDTVRLAKRHGVRVGAHPSLPDLQGFGRREMKMRPRGADRLHRLPGRRAQGLPRRRGHGPRPHQAAWLALRHGGANRGGGQGGRRRRRGVQGAAAWAWSARCTSRSTPPRAWTSSPSTMPTSTMPTTAG